MDWLGDNKYTFYRHKLKRYLCEKLYDNYNNTYNLCLNNTVKYTIASKKFNLRAFPVPCSVVSC